MSQADAADAASVATAPPPPPRRVSKATLPLIAVALGGVLLILYAWRLPPFATTLQTTDNAYVRGQVTMVSPKLDGYVTAVTPQDFMRVAAGQELVRLNDRIYRERLEQARAGLAAQEAALASASQQQRTASATIQVQSAAIAAAQATLVRAQANTRRVETLLKGGWVSAQQRDDAQAALRQAQAGLAQARASQSVAQENLTAAQVGIGAPTATIENARAAVQLAEIDLQNTIIRAPQAGRVGEVGVRLGQYVTPGTQLMQIVPDRVWVIANFKETQMSRLRPGQVATLRIDALKGARIRGHVERISPAAGSEFSVLKADNATGNFTKVAQRIPVRISIDPDQPLAARLAPGMSVTASVDTAR